MQSLGTWFSDGIDSVRLMVGLDDLEGLLLYMIKQLLSIRKSPVSYGSVVTFVTLTPPLANCQIQQLKVFSRWG